jgi:hypothetical protein
MVVPELGVPDKVPVMVMLLPLVSVTEFPETVPFSVKGVPPTFPVTVTFVPD